MLNFKNPFASISGPKTRGATVLRRELVKLIVPSDEKDQGLSSAARRKEITNLIEELGNLNVRLKESDLCGSPGIVVHTQGRAQLWDSFQSVFRGKGRTAVRASQQLGQPGNTLLSRAELGRPDLYITASGTYTVLADGKQRGPLTCPVTIRADVSSGAVHIGDDTTIPLPIRGTGLFDVVYCDKDLRIFTSAGSYSIQIKEDYLDSLL